MPVVSNALIIGGGIAGLSAAVALSKSGVHCDVIEKSSDRLGSSLGLSGRVGEALTELGVYDQSYETGRPFAPGDSVVAQMDSAGNVLDPGILPPFAWPGARIPIGVYRPTFLEILAEAAEASGAVVRTGLTATSIDDGSEAAHVTFSDGTEGDYDLIVGADGIGSQTRTELFADAPTPAYAGQMSMRWMADGPAIANEGWYHSPLGRFGFYYLPHQETVYVAVVLDSAESVRWSQAEAYEVLKNLFDSYTAPAVEELRERLTPDSVIIGRPFESLLIPSPWYRGRTILIGDAAHATTAHMGQGGAMAIEDAVVLGQSIATAGSLAEAFASFTERRSDRVRTVVETSLELSRLEQDRAPVAENMGVMMKAFQVLAQPY
ncbi:FAD-dependent monooxygenase [Subtercola lobariae]|uniref:FAD-binding domain-containing protein n=1 Tax=Subtercola lobariae TaxID=1588641 RepID=A0A917EYD0_9MICO|nr:FAD-dependent monooxygenase [Subtercola lobariae]GGF30505.1 hypothetical protein GCM10011399_24670 [Subtercola lobariae]